MPYLRNGIYYSDLWAPDLENPGHQKRYRQSLGTASLREAKKRESQLLLDLEAAAIKRADEAPHATAAFSGWARRWLELIVIPTLKPSTVRLYEGICRIWLVPHFKDQELRQISLLQMQELVGKIQAKGRGPKWIYEVFSCLSSMLESAVELGYLDLNRCGKVKKPKIPPTEFAWYTEEETERLLSVCRQKEPQWYAYFLFLFRTGARLGEAAGLCWGDVDFQRKSLRLRHSLTTGLALESGELVRVKNAQTTPKNHKWRQVPMSEELTRVLLEHRHPGQRVFLTPAGEECLKDKIRYPWERINRAAGLSLLTPHDIRHSFASQLVSRGVGLQTVKELLGHSTLTMTLRYAHLAPAVGEAAVELLGKPDTQPDTTRILVFKKPQPSP